MFGMFHGTVRAVNGEIVGEDHSETTPDPLGEFYDWQQAIAAEIAINSYDPHRALIEELCGVLEVLTRAVGQKETAAALLTHDAAAWMNVADALPGALATLAKARALSPANTGGK